MKIILKISSVLLLITSFTANSQESKSTNVPAKIVTGNPYEARYIKLKELYLKMLDSESNKKFNKLMSEYLDKSNYKVYKDNIKDYSKLHEWVVANIDKTNFKNAEEANVEWDNTLKAEIDIETENKEYQDYLIDTIKQGEYGVKLFTDMMVDVINTYPEKLGIQKHLTSY